MELGLRDQVVIITGITGGIGESIGRHFLDEGAIVAAFFRGELSRLDALMAYCRESGIPEERVFPVSVNLESKESLAAGVAQVMAKYGKIDVLVNNAGWTVEKPFLGLEDGEWEQVLDVNLTAVANLTAPVTKVMLRQKRGSIINISSVVAKRYGRGVAAYSAAKAAINRFTECLALEMGKKGIRVNTVCPGVIETKMSEGMVFRLSEQILERTPLERFGKPEEVAKAVLFLASDRTASFITGHHLFVDGGVSI